MCQTWQSLKDEIHCCILLLIKQPSYCVATKDVPDTLLHNVFCFSVLTLNQKKDTLMILKQATKLTAVSFFAIISTFMHIPGSFLPTVFHFKRNHETSRKVKKQNKKTPAENRRESFTRNRCGPFPGVRSVSAICCIVCNNTGSNNGNI